MTTQATPTTGTNESGYPFATVSRIAGRVKIPAARVTFYGLDLPDLVGDRNHRNTASGEGRAEFRIEGADGATVNGVPVSCRYDMRLGYTWTPEKDANGDNVRAIRWHWHAGITSRTDISFHPDAPDGARSALHAFAEEVVAQLATPEIMRAAVSAQLANEAERARARATEKRAEFEAAEARAHELGALADDFMHGRALYAARRTVNADPVEHVNTDRAACEKYASEMYVHPYDREEGKLPVCVEIVPAVA